MKKIILGLAAMMMSIVASAQDNQGQAPQRPQMDRGEMAKQRTEQMVKEYGMNEEQAAKLLQVNTDFFEKMPMMGRGPRGGQRGNNPRMGGQRPERNDQQNGQRPDRPMMNREQMQKAMENYNTELQKIMTPEQFKLYQENLEKRRSEGPRGRRDGNRPRPNND